MSRIASVKETGEEVSQSEWKRFEQAVEDEIEERPKAEPAARGVSTADPRASREPTPSN